MSDDIGDERMRSGRGIARRPDESEESLVRESSHLTKWLYDRYGDGLRTVLVYDGAVSEYTYLADHVGEQYSDAELERIADEHAFQDSLSNPHYESLFHLGGTEATVTLFEGATLVQVPFDNTTGVVLTVDRARSLDVDALVETAREEHRPEFVSEA
ncbi:hypothetical protein GCM10009037_18920 [Halarchaeum grantii]|uniref:Uncharacterized protein n=1 Tax=Halarchaeum grantii TaxID=1193105 RepID=A0A830FAP9_9EURY|nr:hypothetical protein [Halarchaeum grantii]GGL35484.1 hypothetical protein GCM10009037_18920 [Halarchaeum grantii]